MLKDLISKPGTLSKCHAQPLTPLDKNHFLPWPWLCERRAWHQNLLNAVIWGCIGRMLVKFLLEGYKHPKVTSSNKSNRSYRQLKKNASIFDKLRQRRSSRNLRHGHMPKFPDYRIITFWFLAPKCCFFRLILSTSLSETLLKKAHLPTLSLQIFEQSFVQRHLTCHYGSSSTYQNPILAIMWMLRMRFFSLAATLSLPLYV